MEDGQQITPQQDSIPVRVLACFDKFKVRNTGTSLA